jgi:hypothetical protein
MIDEELRRKHQDAIDELKDIQFKNNRTYRKVEKCLERIYEQLKNYPDRNNGKLLMSKYLHSDLHNSSIGTTLSKLEDCGVLEERSSSNPKSYEPSVDVERLQVIADFMYPDHPDPEIRSQGFGVEG